MPGKSGLNLLEEIGKITSPPEVIVVTAFGSIETAIKATRLGAYDYVTKPIKPTEILFLIEKAKEKYDLREERNQLRDQLTREIGSNLIAESLAMQNILEIVSKVASTESTVLICGETGTGKECIARLIHLQSNRGKHVMKSINCASFSESLLDSELFGYEKGAFTGALYQKSGVIEAADGGTLFLDEVSDMSQNAQAKLLRVLQERKIRRVGGTDDIPVDIRIVAATNKNLEESVKTGAFREDLFYRLNIVPISIPPLRDREEDIPALIDHFFSRLGIKKSFTPDAIELLLNYKWPGNVRELGALVERVSVLIEHELVGISDLPPELQRVEEKPDTFSTIPDNGIIFSDLERKLITDALQKTNGNMVEAAKLVGMRYRAFRYRAKKIK